MMRPPPPCLIICCAASWVPKNALFRLMARTFSYCCFGGVEHRSARLDAGVVDHDIDAAKVFDGRIDELLQVSNFANIGLNTNRLIAQRNDLFLQSFGRLGMARHSR